MISTMQNIGIFVLTWFSVASCGEPYCKEKVTILSSLDEKSPDGISASQMLEKALGSHLMQMKYHEKKSGEDFVNVHPPAQFTGLEFEVNYEGGEIRYVDLTLVDPGGGGNSVPVICDYGGTEVDVSWVVRSQDGLLNEVLDAKLFVPTQYVEHGENMIVSLTAKLDPNHISGTARFDDILSAHKPTSIKVGLSSSFGGSEGGVGGGSWGGSLRFQNGGSNFHIASWPK